MELDLEYIDRWSLGLDGMILLRTIRISNDAWRKLIRGTTVHAVER